MSKVFQGETSGKTIDYMKNLTYLIASDDYIIHIDKNINSELCKITFEIIVPSAGGLFQAIYCFIQLTDMGGETLIFKALWLPYINFFLKASL